MAISGDDVIERMARARAARADQPGSARPAIAAMMAGAGARLVANQNKARMILDERRRQAAARRQAEKDPQAGSGSRPVATPLPVSSKPAAHSAGALSHEPETSGE